MKKQLSIIVSLLVFFMFAMACQQPVDTMVVQEGSSKAVYQTWDSSAVYNQGDKVTWNGNNWEAKWWSTNEEPGTTGDWGVWKNLGPSTGGDPTPTFTTTSTPTLTATATPTQVTTQGPTPTPADTTIYPAWSSTKVYLGGEIVYWNGHNWKAKWWTQGDEPGAAGDNVPWEDLGTAVAPTATPTLPPAQTIPWPNKVFAPYVDVNAYPQFSIGEMAVQTGVKFYTLAFILADNNGQPAWGGVVPYGDNYYRDEIDSVRRLGGNVIVSFGGAAGTELAMADSNPTSLAAKYQAVIDEYELTWIDFDIEGAAVADSASIDVRNKAIKILRQNNPDLIIAFCLPVLPSGLTPDGLNVINNAKSNGVEADMINIMAMDYGDWAAPNPDGKMGDYSIDAMNNLFTQLKGIFPSKSDADIWKMVGVTPMIGQNDVPSEVIDLNEAQEIYNYAYLKGVSLLSMWSSNRDNGSGGRNTQASPHYSGIVQDDFAFSNMFKSFTR